MEDERVKQLAETLRKQGLAASVYEATEKAKSILNVRTQKSYSSEEQRQTYPDQPFPQQPFSDDGQGMANKQIMPDLDLDIKSGNVTLNELLREVNVLPEEVEALEQERLDDAQEKINDAKESLKAAEENPEKIEQLKEEIARVKDDVGRIIEEQAGEEPRENEDQPQDSIFKEEEKIDLAKAFGTKK